ncbi:alpha/beta hydrolase [Mycobacterium sp. Aquia_216]|uniref:alpha/beta hydrolase n=1 Tax=Mycobacterium sp. Aquia_216 TaxID=2991729 RepID=UPI00227C5F01|nr:alpha/beta hydrolase [Mycobacterium sp. Aquia_216]WAJ42879.1 alpha/beta hydrolase [Mycobacterium sp. Aquia_216]
MADTSRRNAFVSRNAVDPGLRNVARFLPRGYALHRGYKVPRALMQLMGSAGRLRHIPTVAVNEHVTVRLHRPAGISDRAPAMLWIHGGGTLMGTAVQDDKFCRKLSHLTGVAVAAVEHRLAPEHPYPAPLEDCYAALRWLARQPWVDPDRVAIGGASAGGHFAAAVAQRARDRKDVRLAFQMLAYPMLDDRTGADASGAKRLMWTESDNQLAWQWYLNGADPVEAAPARRPDLSGLPPAWIGVGTLDLYLQECLDYGRRLRGAGVPVHEEIVPGAFHAFDRVVENAPVSRRFFASQRDHLWAALSSPPPSDAGIRSA